MRQIAVVTMVLSQSTEPEDQWSRALWAVGLRSLRTEGRETFLDEWAEAETGNSEPIPVSSAEMIVP